MRIDFSSSATSRQVASARSQITSKDDLKKFDDFLARYSSFDFNDGEQVSAAKACCGGENCCQNITISVPTPK
jgi:hypothetical protein